jgi:hypothetical protein
MKWALGRYCSERDKFMFTFGINIGLGMWYYPFKVNKLVKRDFDLGKGCGNENTPNYH